MNIEHNNPNLDHNNHVLEFSNMNSPIITPPNGQSNIDNDVNINDNHHQHQQQRQIIQNTQIKSSSTTSFLQVNRFTIINHQQSLIEESNESISNVILSSTDDHVYDDDDDDDIDDCQQLTFISNKSFPLDSHCHTIRLPAPSSSPSQLNIDDADDNGPIEIINNESVQLQQSQQISLSPPSTPLLNDNNDENNSITNISINHCPRASFQSFKSMPLNRIEDDDADHHHLKADDNLNNNDLCRVVSEINVNHHHDDQQSKIIDTSLYVDDPIPPSPSYHFEHLPLESNLIRNDDNNILDFIDSTITLDSQISNQQELQQQQQQQQTSSSTTTTITATNQDQQSSSLNRQQSHSTNDLMDMFYQQAPPPPFEQLFDKHGHPIQASTTNNNQSIIDCSNNNDSNSLIPQSIYIPTTPSPYDRLMCFRQRYQHLMAPSPTSSLVRRRSLPPQSSIDLMNRNNQQNHLHSSLLSNNLRQQQQQSNSLNYDGGYGGGGGQIPPAATSSSSPLPPSKEKRIGHRRVNEDGQVTYKKIKSTQLMYSIQLGIGYSVGSMASKPERDLLMRDFMQIETVHFPKSGSQITPAHHYTDFTFSTFTPFAFRYFRDLFRIQPDDFMLSITNESLQELSNPGASGSMFFRTRDDQFIIKTVEKSEAKFLLKLLPGYYMNLSQNPQTLLPKFFGLYCYECIGKNIRILVMNNLLPSNITIHQKYDLKGSTYKRKANEAELKKQLPTFKDLDFLDYYYNNDNKVLITHFSKMAEFNTNINGETAANHNNNNNNNANGSINNANNGNNNSAGDDLNRTASSSSFPTKGGLLLESFVYDELIETLERDCRVLQSFEIMDYSLLIGIHNYDQAIKDNQQQRMFDYDNDDELPVGAIRAMNRKGDRLLLFMGIIDILQSYRLAKKVEHAWKSILHDGRTISVIRPDFYAKRFLEFMCEKVFGRLPSMDSHQSSSSLMTKPNYYTYKRQNSATTLNRRFRSSSGFRSGNGGSTGAVGGSYDTFGGYDRS